jgi:hypothetical protein
MTVSTHYYSGDLHVTINNKELQFAPSNEVAYLYETSFAGKQVTPTIVVISNYQLYLPFLTYSAHLSQRFQKI